MIALALMTLAVAGTAFAAGAARQATDVFRFDDGSDVGNASLVRTNSGVSMTIKSSIEGNIFEFPDFDFPGDELGPLFSPGDATTNWFVVFNDPGACTAPCGEDDILASIFGGNDDVMVDILFATGHIAGNKWRAGAHLNEGDTSGSILPGFNVEPIGLIDAMAAEIHVIVRSHGPASDLTQPGEVAAAISSVDGGCSTNICGDAQFAVFIAQRWSRLFEQSGRSL